MRRLSVQQLLIATTLYCAMTAQGQGDPFQDDPEYSRELIEEMVIRGRSTETPAMQEMLDSYIANQRGIYYYSLRLYKKAYPYLLQAAKEGFKESQARLGYIYQAGLNVVEPNWIEAVGWLGVAASPDSRPEIKNYFKRLYRRIPDERHELIDEIVAAYVAKYGSNATGVDCSMGFVSGSAIKRMRCFYEEEWKYRDQSAGLGIPQVDTLGSSVGGTVPGFVE